VQPASDASYARGAARRRPAADGERGLDRHAAGAPGGQRGRRGDDEQRDQQRAGQQRDAGRPVRGRAERVGLRGGEPPGDQRAGGKPERRCERGEHEVVGDEHAGDLRRGEPDRAQQPDLAARGKHAAADRGGEREARGQQREQRGRLEDGQQPARVVGELRALRAPVERAHAVALDAAGERLRGTGVRQPQRDAVADPTVARRQPEDVGRVGPAAVVGARGRADADHLQRAVAGDDRGAEADGVLARPVALQHDLARAADAAALEDQRVLDSRARAREADQADAVGAAVDGHADDRARALGRDHTALPRDPPEGGGVGGDDRDVRAVGGVEEAVVGGVERGPAVERDHERADGERDHEAGEDGIQRPGAEVGTDDSEGGGEHDLTPPGSPRGSAPRRRRARSAPSRRQSGRRALPRRARRRSPPACRG
jgi:hypothetical protein